MGALGAHSAVLVTFFLVCIDCLAAGSIQICQEFLRLGLGVRRFRSLLRLQVVLLRVFRCLRSLKFGNLDSIAFNSKILAKGQHL